MAPATTILMRPTSRIWVKTGPHVMIVGKAAQEMAANYPNKVDADSSHPFVMFPGTKYQHLMLPADIASGH